ncbi:phenylalanine--tRNA ligase subunit beta [Dongshaea marina]|uniref:phenylalanine--tRNA ligase subunit beta n=1 Tax=Dongshaea marina TaxID=2047966 RepID=UPI000D3E4A96|nr:phenylalanine--tRNA ligase subunit beta [Dongshaea marina]
MKFSKSWLQEWVKLDKTADELAEQITMAGLEVDEVAPVAGEFSGVVVGEVVECGQHPDADKLRVTKVNVGAEELLDIVCGASNCRLGLKVAVACVGAVLPGNFKIKKAKLRGRPSFGMLCSYTELGIDVESDGIIELPQDAAIGTDIRELLQLDDQVIDVDLTANRGDCLSIAGIAREVAALNRTSVCEPEFSPVAPSLDDRIEIQLAAPAACARYQGRIIRNINLNAATPLWMQEKLRRCGIRSIDPVVDVTNYVLLEYGQPMHAFDLNTLKGGITVRQAEAAEKLVLLDGKEITLEPDVLVIADDERAVAMAGIFGGEATSVTESTRDILLECAWFNPDAIRGRARRYGLHTDSSHRFERGVNPQLQSHVMERATELLVSICGGEVAPVCEAVSEQHIPQAQPIELRREKLNALIGFEFKDEDVVSILNCLGMQVEALEQGWRVVAPAWRFDMAIEQDLIEEVARLYGYNNLPSVAPAADLKMTNHREAELPLSRLRQLLVDRGYQEAITYSFVDPKLQQKLFPEQEALILPHPISEEMSAMRLSLLPGLLDAALYNQNRQQSRVRLFESGLRFVPDADEALAVKQQQMLSVLVMGSVSDEHWDLPTRAVDFFDLKGDLEALIDLTGYADRFEFRAVTHSALHPGQCAGIFLDERQVGVIGTVHPAQQKAVGLKSKAVVFEIELEALTERLVPEIEAVSKFPANRRDLALIVDREVAAGDLLQAIKKLGQNHIVGINLFDIYQGQGVAEDKKSVAIALTLQDQSRTLEEQEIAETIDCVVEALKAEFNATLRV